MNYISPVRITICIIFFLFSCTATAQVLNMDRASAPNDSSKKWHTSLQAATDYNSEKEVFDWDTRIDVTRFTAGHHLLSSKFSNSFTNTNGSNLQNAGYLHIRFRDNDSRKISPEYFTQYQWDDLRGMLNRYLLGCNMRIMLKENKKFDFYMGIGLMYEWEKWNFDGVAADKLPLVHPDFIKTDQVKLNQYFKLSAQLFTSTEITVTNFIQAPLDKGINHPRLANFLQWNIPLSKKVGLNLNFESLYDAAPVVPIKNFYFNYQTGFSVAL
ncbi:MAG: hypothetical protein WCG67_08360 [Ferruginibacter sp.]